MGTLRPFCTPYLAASSPYDRVNRPGESRGADGRKLAARARDSESNPIRQRSKDDAALSFLLGLEGLESAVRGDLEFDGPKLDKPTELVEELAAMIERGEELLPSDITRGSGPGRPEGGPLEPRESAESFIGRLEAGLAVFKDVIAGRLKTGNILPGRSSEDGALAGVFTDFPDDRSTLPPNIPEHAMSMYKFGERVLYILRRGYQSQSLSKPLELLDAYGLLSEDLTLTTQLWKANDGILRGKAAIMRHFSALGQMAAPVQTATSLLHSPSYATRASFELKTILLWQRPPAMSSSSSQCQAFTARTLQVGARDTTMLPFRNRFDGASTFLSRQSTTTSRMIEATPSFPSYQTCERLVVP